MSPGRACWALYLKEAGHELCSQYKGTVQNSCDVIAPHCVGHLIPPGQLHAVLSVGTLPRMPEGSCLIVTLRFCPVEDYQLFRQQSCLSHQAYSLNGNGISLALPLMASSKAEQYLNPEQGHCFCCQAWLSLFFQYSTQPECLVQCCLSNTRCSSQRARVVTKGMENNSVGCQCHPK